LNAFRFLQGVFVKILFVLRLGPNISIMDCLIHVFATNIELHCFQKGVKLSLNADRVHWLAV
jgi:hypothetical protein